VVASSLLVLCLAADPGPAGTRAARAELDACAARIEQLKARGDEGAELDRLLRRAAELAAELEPARTAAPPSTSAPGAEELRERADAARDHADRLAAEIGAIDVRLQDARRADDSVQRAAVGGAPSGTEAKVRALQAARAELAARRTRVLDEAERLEREAKAVERER
jgi:chromosome segregation ATPase